MALTVGTGPFGHNPGGVFNRPLPELRGLIWFESFPRRMRGVFAGETAIDSRRAKLLHEHGLLPVLYFPEEDVRADLLEPSEKRTRCPWKGEASYWSLRAGERSAADAAWSYPEPIEGAPPLAGHLAFVWSALDEWLEEDEPAIVHVRDPYHRVDAIGSSRHVRVSLGGETLAESRRPRALFETGLPTRWYLPREDVRMDLLEPSEKRTGCAYKGYASYWTARAGGEVSEDLAWSYEEPLREAASIEGMICFLNERVDLEVDGETQERPRTNWS